MKFINNLKNYTETIPPAFGLDISDSSMKFVQFSEDTKGLEIDLYAQKFIPEGIIEKGAIKNTEKLSAILKDALKKYRDSGLYEYVIFSLPDEQSFLKLIQLPGVGEDELESAILVEAERNIPIDISDAYLDYFVLSRGQVQNILLVASKRDVVDNYVKAIIDSDLRPIIAEPEVLAISRSVLSQEEIKQQCVVVEIGANRTRLLGYMNGSVIFTGSVDFSAQEINTLFAKEFNIDMKKAKAMKWNAKLLEDIKNSAKIESILKDPFSKLAKTINENILAWNNSDKKILFKPQKIIFSGGGAAIPQIVEKVSATLGIPGKKADPLANIFKNNTQGLPMDKKTALFFSTALGLAARGISFADKEVFKDFI